MENVCAPKWLHCHSTFFLCCDNWNSIFKKCCLTLFMGRSVSNMWNTHCCRGHYMQGYCHDNMFAFSLQGFLCVTITLTAFILQLLYFIHRLFMIIKRTFIDFWVKKHFFFSFFLSQKTICSAITLTNIILTSSSDTLYTCSII